LEPLYNVSNGNPVTIGERNYGAYDSDVLIWRYMFYGPFQNLESFRENYRKMMEVPNMLVFTVFDSQHHTQIGVTTLMRNKPNFLVIEIGHIWYSPIAQRTGANIEACYLVLKHTFALGYRRVEWKCNAINERSKASALKIGFKFEGIQEYHMIVKNINRDTAWFRILDYEWNDIKAALENRLYNA
jgi:RimJ/RimL family protein N-acetyltransferase